MKISLLLVWGLGAGLPCWASADNAASALAKCESAIEGGANSIPVVSAPSCAPADPTCAALKKESASIRDVQKAGTSRCVAKGKTQCQKFAAQLGEQMDENHAWQIAMSRCSKSAYSVDARFMECLCNGGGQGTGASNSPTAPKAPAKGAGVGGGSASVDVR